MLSDRAEKTSEVVVLSASLGDPSSSPPGIYRVGFLATCGSIFAFFRGAGDLLYLAGPIGELLAAHPTPSDSQAFDYCNFPKQCDF